MPNRFARWRVIPACCRLLGLILVLLLAGCSRTKTTDVTPASNDHTEVVESGEILTPDPPPKPPPPTNDPTTIKESLEAGKTYRVVQKMAFAARGQDIDWGTADLIKIGVAAEQIFTRLIESNDGKTVVEVRTFESYRVVKVLAGAADFTLDPGAPDREVLTMLAKVKAGRRARIDPVKPVIDAIVRPDPAALAGDPSTRVFAAVPLLAGKKVRLTSIDGKGVVSIEPIDCSLNAWERDHLMNKDLLGQARFLLSILNTNPGAEVTLPGFLFSDLLALLDPSPAPRVTGQVVVKRETDREEGGKKVATLRVKPADSELKVAEQSHEGQVIATLRPGGELQYLPDDRLIRTVRLTGAIRVEALPKDSPAGKASFVEEPQISFSYFCEKR